MKSWFLFWWNDKFAMHFHSINRKKIAFDTYDSCMTVKMYLDKKGFTEKRHKYNILGVEWCTSFLKRHKDLTKRFVCNTKTERTAISEKTIKQYASDLENEVHGVSFVHWLNSLFVDPSGVKLWLFSQSNCLIFNL